MDNIEGKQQQRRWETGVMSLVWVFSLCACVKIPMFSSVPLEPLFTLGPGNQKQHKQNNSNNNNKTNSIHISMEQHCPGGLTLAGQPSHVRSGPSGWTQNKQHNEVGVDNTERQRGQPTCPHILIEGPFCRPRQRYYSKLKLKLKQKPIMKKRFRN